HLDFISIRPAGSHILWAPLVAVGGEYTIWISRFVPWLQFAAISWIWVLIFEKAMGARIPILQKTVLAVIGFCLSVNGFPLMPWHILDAIFFSSIGALLCTSSSKGRKTAGFFLIGAAALFRLNFLPMIFASLIAFEGWKKLRFWIAALAPSAIYVIYLYVNGALADAMVQMGSYTDFFHAGIERYLFNAWFLIGLGLGLALAFLSYARPKQFKFFGAFGMVSAQFFFAFGLLDSAKTENPVLFYDWTFLAFGIAAGLAVVLLVKSIAMKKMSDPLAAFAIALAIAWCGSISIGINSPCLMLGPLCTGLSIFAFLRIKSSEPAKSRRFSNLPKIAAAVSIALLLVFSAAVFAFVRENNIYCEMPASKLDRELGGVFPGAEMIKTNGVTYSILLDLEDAKGMVSSQGKKYCIIPDCTANWVKDPQPNPFCIDWPQWIELGNGPLLERAKKNLSEQRGNVSIILQRFMATDWGNIYLGPDWVPKSLSVNDYPIVQYVLENFNKTAETEYFEIYE
ncbi:MAG: hypothetical protein PHH26_08015, partial [Candidatus Thermoplasmatota archaeon]|nr:hypothetical protein [Candidatus Thermoplasmatota archaeon]